MLDKIAMGFSLLAIAAFAWQNRHVSPEARYRAGMTAFLESRRGTSGREITEELAYRTRLARVRRTVSDAVKREPGRHNDHIAEAAQREALGAGPVVGKAILEACATLPASDILYGDALAAAMAEGREHAEKLRKGIRINEDDLAAVTIR